MILVDQLEFTYPGASSPAVKKIQFNIHRGEIFGFLGPSGAGKSTTQKVLIKLLQPYSGKVEILEKPLSNWGKDFYNYVGVGFELPNHYLKLTALENLQFFASFYDRPTRPPLDLLSMVGLEDAAKQKVGAFSKGMKMRLNFIRSFMHDPEIIFFDEPTSGLDPVNARQMKDIILQLKAEGKTIFLTTHQMQDADELCDRVAFIIDGEISLIDAPKSLKLQYGQRQVSVEYGNGKLQKADFPLDNIGENQQFLTLLKKESIRTIHTKEATLEDIFIEVTGKQLRH